MQNLFLLFLCAATIYSCGPSETEKRNAVMTGLINQERAITKRIDSLMGMIYMHNNDETMKAINDRAYREKKWYPLDFGIDSLEWKLKNVKRSIDSLKAMK